MLINEFFKLGALYNWNEKISRVTGEKLNPAHFSDVYYKTHEKI
jgi:Zn-dependent M32 family carboxypeptidase